MSRANFKVSKNKSKGFVHFIMYGEETKIKKYDYMVYSEIKQRIKILTKEQVRKNTLINDSHHRRKIFFI
jgi:hypothetical protein